MKNEKYKIILKYKNEKGRIRILGEGFVKRNKDNCKMIYNGEEKELSDFILNEESNEKENIEIIKNIASNILFIIAFSFILKFQPNYLIHF